MKKGKAYTLDFRRKREGKTDYKTRLRLLSSGRPRIVLRKTLNSFSVQFVKFDSAGDKVLVSASTLNLLKYGWKGHCGNLSSAYLVGLLCGLKAKKNRFDSGILDLGIFRAVPGSSFFAAVKGLVDVGVKVAFKEDVLPSYERVSGKHIELYASSLAGKEQYGKKFSKYLHSGLKPEEFSKHFEEVKKNIIKDGAN